MQDLCCWIPCLRVKHNLTNDKMPDASHTPQFGPQSTTSSRLGCGEKVNPQIQYDFSVNENPTRSEENIQINMPALVSL